MSQPELAAFIQSHLAKNAINSILTGGAALSYYVGAKYVSEDIDLVLDWIVGRRKLDRMMSEIGFHKKARYYQHPDTVHIVEFMGDLPSVGNESIGTPLEQKLATGTLRVLSPSDCLKDRLAAFYHWNDTEALEQALLLASEQRVDFEDVERWSQVEGKEKEYKLFFTRLNK